MVKFGYWFSFCRINPTGFPLVALIYQLCELWSTIFGIVFLLSATLDLLADINFYVIFVLDANFFQMLNLLYNNNFHLFSLAVGIRRSPIFSVGKREDTPLFSGFPSESFAASAASAGVAVGVPQTSITVSDSFGEIQTRYRRSGPYRICVVMDPIHRRFENRPMG